MFRTRTVSPLSAPDTPLDITIHFDKGIPVKVVTPQQTVTDSLELFELLNALGKEHGVGRIVSIRWRRELWTPTLTFTHRTLSRTGNLRLS